MTVVVLVSTCPRHYGKAVEVVLVAAPRSSKMRRQSWVKRTYAFFLPSGRMSVFTFAAFTSYMAWTASLMLILVDFTSTMNTSVLISSIFFMADSVVTGYWMMRYLSILGRTSTDLLGYFGSRFLLRVLGRKKCTLVLTLLCFLDTEPFTALATLAAFFAPPFFGSSPSAPASAGCFLLFGAIATSARADVGGPKGRSQP